MMTDLRLAIVDAHPVLRDGVKSAVERRSGFSFVASGSEAGHVCEILSNYRIDVLLLDICIGGDIFAAISEASSNFPKVTIVAFTEADEINGAVRALTSGADAYVLKSSSIDELFDAILIARRGRVFISKPIDVGVFSLLKAGAGALSQQSIASGGSKASNLSSREVQIIKLLMIGKKNREIANALRLTERTIKYYMSQLMLKMHVRSRLEIVVFVKALHPELF